MNPVKSHFRGRIVVSIAIVFFTVAATAMIMSRTSILPKSIASNLSQAELIDRTELSGLDFSAYIAFHQTVSPYYVAAVQDISNKYCRD